MENNLSSTSSSTTSSSSIIENSNNNNEIRITIDNNDDNSSSSSYPRPDIVIDNDSIQIEIPVDNTNTIASSSLPSSSALTLRNAQTPNPSNNISDSNLMRTSSNTASLILPPFLRQLSNTSSSRRTYYCSICLETYPIAQSYQLSCSHRFCKTCLYEYFKAKINERQVFLTCFAESKYDEPIIITSPSRSNINTTNTIPSPPTMINNNNNNVMSTAVNPMKVTVVSNSNIKNTTASASNIPSSSASSSSSSLITDNPKARLICSMPIRETDILAVLSSFSDGSSIIEKYHRFVAEGRNPNLRACPFCSTLQEGKATEPVMICKNEACQKEFCFLHSNAHIGSTCAVFEEQHANENRLNEQTIAKDTKPCPNCGIPISKLAGCNHMKCTSCGTSFCWLCGKKVEDSELPTHFQFWNIAGCPNKQFNENNGSWRQFFSNIVLFFVFGIPSVILTFALFISCPCICIPVALTDNNGFFSFFMTIASIIMYLLLMFLGTSLGLPFVVGFGICILPFLCLYTFCSACCGGSRRRNNTPGTTSSSTPTPTITSTTSN